MSPSTVQMVLRCGSFLMQTTSFRVGQRQWGGDTVAVSTDGVKWSEDFATDTNVLSSVSIQLGSISASRVRVVMHEVRFLVLWCCFATWLALVAGISVLPRSCSVWHKRAGCSCAAPANHCRGLCGGSRQRRCSRQILCELCRGGRPLFEQGIAQRAACA